MLISQLWFIRLSLGLAALLPLLRIALFIRKWRRGQLEGSWWEECPKFSLVILALVGLVPMMVLSEYEREVWLMTEQGGKVERTKALLFGSASYTLQSGKQVQLEDPKQQDEELSMLVVNDTSRMLFVERVVYGSVGISSSIAQTITPRSVAATQFIYYCQEFEPPPSSVKTYGPVDVRTELTWRKQPTTLP